MGDEKEGPYKVVAKLTGYRETTKYTIVEQQKHDVFLREIVPDAGTGETARQLCNLLNKEQKVRDAEWLAAQQEEVARDEAERSAR